MKTRKFALLTAFSFISFMVNANNVFIKNIYTTSTGTEKPVTVSLNNKSKEIPFNTTVNLGKLDTIKKLTIRTASTLPVTISKIEQLNYEAAQHSDQNALLVVYPSLPTNLGAWNIQREWLPQRPTNQAPTTNPQTSTQPTQQTAQAINPNAQFCKMDSKGKINSIEGGFLGKSPYYNMPYSALLGMILENEARIVPNKMKTIKELLNDNDSFCVQNLKMAIDIAYKTLTR